MRKHDQDEEVSFLLIIVEKKTQSRENSPQKSIMRGGIN